MFKFMLGLLAAVSLCVPAFADDSVAELEKKLSEAKARVAASHGPQDVSEFLQDISVTIVSESPGSKGEGSGVIVTRKRDNESLNFVWTAAHVVENLRHTRTVVDPVSGSTKTVVEFHDAKIVKDLVDNGRSVGKLEMFAEVIRFSADEDLALLRVRKKNYVAVSAKFYLDDKIPPIGTDLIHVGSLLGQMGSNSMTRGIMSAHGRLIDKKVFDQSTCAAFPGCLTEDTLIEMADGSLKKITEVKEGEQVLAYDSMISMANGTWRNTIQEGDQVLSFHTMTGEKTKKVGNSISNRPVVRGKVTRVIPSGVKPIYQIKTWNKSIKASGNHPFVVIRSMDAIDRCRYLVATWARADEIKPGDIVGVMDSHTPYRHSSGINLNKTFGQKTDKVKIMRLLGFYVGDGYSRVRAGQGGEVCLYTFDDHDSDYYANILRREFKVRTSTVPTKSGSWIRASNVALARKLENLGICGYATTKRIPDWVYQCPPDLQRSFLEGLVDADGWRRENGNWGIELANEDLIKDIYMLTNHLGIRTSNISTRSKTANIDGRDISSTCWALEIYPNAPFQNAEMSGTKDLLPSGLRFERVASVDLLGEEMTYDLTVDRYHNFFANGFLVHNSSGGAVFMTDGRVMGMVLRGAGETFNLIKPIRLWREWAKTAKVEWAVDEHVPLPSEEELKKLPIEDNGIVFSYSAERAGAAGPPRPHTLPTRIFVEQP